MTIKPMLCKAPVVRAMLDGRQTQDRRPIGNDRVWEEIRLKGRCIHGNQGYVHGKSPDELELRFAEEDRQIKLPGLAEAI